MDPRIPKAVLAFLACVPAGCQTVPHLQAKQQAEKHWSEVRGRVKLQLARQQYEGGLFQEASDSLAESMTLDPGRVESYVLLARAQLELGRQASAEATVAAAVARGLDSAELHYARGVILEQREQAEEAIREYERAHAMSPGDVDMLAARAECLVSLGRHDEAAALLEENLYRFDEPATVTMLAARVAELRGQAPRALEFLELAALSAPQPSVLGDELILQAARAGLCDRAIAQWDSRPPSAEPAAPAVVRGVGQCLLERNQAQRAQTVLAAHLVARPDDYRAQFLLAQASLETDDLQAAAHALEAARRYRPDSPQVLLAEAALRWRRGELAAAADALYALLERYPTDGDAYLLLAQVLEARDQSEAAQECRNRAAKLQADCYNPVEGPPPERRAGR